MCTKNTAAMDGISITYSDKSGEGCKKKLLNPDKNIDQSLRMIQMQFTVPLIVKIT